MPDISMCMNEECQKKESCYRFTATPNPYSQCYIGAKPEENGECQWYIEKESEE